MLLIPSTKRRCWKSYLVMMMKPDNFVTEIHMMHDDFQVVFGDAVDDMWMAQTCVSTTIHEIEVRIQCS